jgi:small nuclear ribonucleoprotein B and B'
MYTCLNSGAEGRFQPPPKAKGGKMLSLINWRLKVTLNDGRQLVGQMLAYDKHMNLVLAECEEFRHVRAKKKAEETGERPEQEIKRTLGLVILRGEIVVSLSVEGPPPVQEDDSKNPVSLPSCINAMFTGHTLLLDSILTFSVP